MLTLALLACGAGDKPGTDSADDGLDCGNPQTFYPDVDGDGYGATDQGVEECRAPDGYTRTPGDCDDDDAAVSPAGTEVCNGVDDDCDGAVDPASAEDTITCHTDGDGDGYGDPDTAEVTCACAGDQVMDGTDCDDSDPAVYPGAEEIIYDGIDQACDGDAGEYDRDGDGYNAAGTGAEPEGDCDDDDDGIHPGMLDLCDDEIDQDCDSLYDECGLSETMTPDDAWWTVSRDVTVEGDSAVFGWQPLFAGDGDGDGSPELLVREAALYNDEKFCRFHLVGAPAGSSGGEVLLDDVVRATWAFPPEDGYATHMVAPTSLADVDLDGDGHVDYVLNPDLGSGSEAAGTYIAPGPVEGEQDVAGLGRVAATASLTPMGAARLLQRPEDGDDWQIAQALWPTRSGLEGEAHAAIALLASDDFAEDADLSTVRAIWTDGDGSEPRTNLVVEDIDGDGFRDIIASSQPHSPEVPPGRVWFLRGPFDDDRVLSDADVVLERGASDAISFGISIDLLDDADGDGHRTLLVGDPSWRDDQTDALQLFEPSALGDGVYVGTDEAFARIEATASTDGGASTGPAYLPSALLPDLDADGEVELAVPTVRYESVGDIYRGHVMDVPGAGVVTLDAPRYQITTDETLDDSTAFGSRISGDHDLDGDGWNDLLIGEPYWNADPDNSSRPYGRFMVFRGDVLR